MIFALVIKITLDAVYKRVAVAAFVLDSKVVALWFFIVAFLPNTCMGAACGAVLYKVLPIRKFAEELRK